MKKQLLYSYAMLSGVALLLTTSIADAHNYGMSSTSRGRGTEYTDSRGGSAYVGPHGAEATGANGNSAARDKDGTTATGEKNANGSTTYKTSNGGQAYVGPNGAAAEGANGNYGATTYNGNHYSGSTSSGYYQAGAYHPTSGYVTTIPSGYTSIYYGGYNCYFVAGVYYRPIFYAGATVYVVVQ